MDFPDKALLWGLCSSTRRTAEVQGVFFFFFGWLFKKSQYEFFIRQSEGIDIRSKVYRLGLPAMVILRNGPPGGLTRRNKAVYQLFFPEVGP